MTSEWMPPGAYAGASRGKIVFNDRYASDLATVEEMVERDISAGFHPQLGSCTSTEFLAYHEAAHIIDLAHWGEAEARLRERFPDPRELWSVLSGYSFQPSGELFSPEALAEAFAAVLCNGGNWAEQELYHFLVG